MRKHIFMLAMVMFSSLSAEVSQEDIKRYLGHITEGLGKDAKSKELEQAFNIMCNQGFSGNRTKCWYDVMKTAIENNNLLAMQIAAENMFSDVTTDVHEDKNVAKSTAQFLKETLSYTAATSAVLLGFNHIITTQNATILSNLTDLTELVAGLKPVNEIPKGQDINVNL